MQVTLDEATLEFVIRKQAEMRAQIFWSKPEELSGLENLETAVKLAKSMPFKVGLWEVQNVLAQRLDGTLSAMKTQAAQGNESAKTWVTHMTSLADILGLRVA